tara:strand:- start:22899 stop:23333 length:435 start_codon:yes stop_codon:yes gene_type:complete
MKKRELGILGAIILGIFLIGFFNITGKVINNTLEECNIADFNADGNVDYLDKVKFNRIYEANLKTQDYCGLGDLNEDGKINEADSNAYAVIFKENYGSRTGSCNLRKFDCGEVEEEITREIVELPSEKIGIWQGVKTFFKKLFN